MMWSLAIIVCLAKGQVVQCEEFVVRPYDDRIDCIKAGNEVRAELEAVNPLYLSVECEAGVFS